MTASTQLSTRFRFSLFSIFAGLVVFMILIHFRTEFVFIVADRREVLCLVHRIEPNQQGFTFPLWQNFALFFQPNVNFPSLFLILNRFPLAVSLVYYDYSRLDVSEFRFGLGYVLLASKQKSRSAALACPGFECVLRTRAFVCSYMVGRGVTCVTGPSFRDFIVKCVLRCDALFLIFGFGVQRSRFRFAAVGPNLPIRLFSLVRNDVCLRLYFSFI